MADLKEILKKKKYKLSKHVGMGRFYQHNRSNGGEARWHMIENRLSGKDRSLFDVGCNMGVFTKLAAERSMFAIGADGYAPAIGRAVKENSGTPGLAFGNWLFSPDNIKNIPPFDVVLCLSIHHYWYREYGEAACWDMVRHLGRNSNKLFFEPSVRAKKYGKTPPAGFVEGDSDHVEAQARKFVAQKLRKKIEFLGETPAPGDEGFRPMFLIS